MSKRFIIEQSVRSHGESRIISYWTGEVTESGGTRATRDISKAKVFDKPGVDEEMAMRLMCWPSEKIVRHRVIEIDESGQPI